VRVRSAAPRTTLLAAVVGLVALVLAGCGTPAGATDKSKTSGTITLKVDGRERSYLLEPATGTKTRKGSALVAVLHQEGGTPEGVAKETALQELRSAGATLVYPAGVEGSWDAGKCCGIPSRQNIDDVRFLDAVLKDASQRVRVDPKREALVGYSSGGMLTYRYVCARPGKLAVAVVVSGSLESTCDAGITVPDVLTLHGKRDGTIGLTRPIFITRLGLAPRPAASTLSMLTTSAGCGKGVTSQAYGAEVRRWEGCRGGSVIEALLIPEAGHGWGNLDASRRTLAFLRQRLLGG
jgi:poly(3-hydroxybutyrate) depolymerase